MNRRSFLFSAGATLGGTVLASRFGRWFRQGSGVYVRDAVEGTLPGAYGKSALEQLVDPQRRYIELVHYFDVPKPKGIVCRADDYIPVAPAPRSVVTVDDLARLYG